MNINFNELAEGAALEQINGELQKVFENIKNPNTDEKAKRKLTITMTFSPDKYDSDVVNTSIDVKTALASVAGVGTRFIVDTDNDGNIVAAEWGKAVEMKGQVSVEDIEAQEPTNVIDYQSKVN